MFQKPKQNQSSKAKDDDSHQGCQMSVTTTDNNSFQDYSHLKDQTTQSIKPDM